MTVRSRLPALDRLVWRLTAPVYDRLARPVRPGRAWVADALDLSADDRVCLLGCGTGLDLESLPTDAVVVAVDRSPAMVGRCRQRARALDRDIETRIGDARSVSAPDGAFDAVLVHLVLSVTDDPAAVLAEASRLVGAGGRVSILDEPAETPHTQRLRAAGMEARRTASFDGYRATIAGPTQRESPTPSPTD